MASADSRLCDLCKAKAFYDCGLNYDFQAHPGAVYESAASWHAYLNQSPISSDTTSLTPSGLNTTLIGAYNNGTLYAGYLDGRIGAIAFYNIALQDYQVYQISRDMLQLV